ncbi:MAG TPA: glycosyltransferase [Steroidobacteraceae bacterium]|nr:glycosyltransferase [Steroidobacteraceae bacterium]
MDGLHLVDTTLFYSPTSGGVRRYLNAKHAWLATHTHWEHTIVVPGRRNRFERGGLCTLSGFTVPGTFNYRLPLSVRRWKRVLDRLEPTLIEAGDAFHPGWCAASVARRRAIPVVGFYHSNVPQIIGRRFRSIERPVRRYLRSLYGRFDAVLAPSRVMCEYLGALGVHHTLHQPLGVDAEIFHPRRGTLDLRARLNLSPGTRLLAYAGRFAGEKNLPVLLEAFARLGDPYHLLLIGGHRRARPAHNVTMVPYRRDSAELASWIASADALVHAGTKETFGLVVLEAMACGRPVIAARAGAFPELVDESVGMLAEPDSAEGMAAAITALYERDVAAVGAAARAHVLKQFTWDRTFRQQIDTYAALIGARRPVVEAGALNVAAP